MSLERKDLGLRFILRNNFHDWKMSVISTEPIRADYGSLFHTTPPTDPKYTGDPLASCYFEGFPDDLIFGYFSKDAKRFSAEIHGRHALWTAIYLTLRDRGAETPLVWRTSKDRL